MKPPLVLYLLLLFACRGLIVLIISLSFREDSERLIRIFYPQPYHFYLSLIPILPAFVALYLVSKRTILWSNQRFKIFMLMPWLMTMALILDACIQFYMLWQIDFRYSITHGVSIVIAITCLSYIWQSRYIKSLINDWQTP